MRGVMEMKVDQEAFGVEDAGAYVFQFLCSCLDAVIVTM